MSSNFYALTPEVAETLRQAKLTAAEWRIWSYLVGLDPWGDRYIEVETLDILQQCECSKATFYRAMGKFQEIGLFDFQAKLSFKNEAGFSKSVSKTRTESQNCETSLKNETPSLKNETAVAEMRKPEPETPTQQGFQKLSDSSDLQTYKPPTERVAGTKSEIKKPELTGKEIPTDLRRKLEQLEILKGTQADARVLRAIASRDISQAYGAAAHVERSFESCSNPIGVFLFQLPRQPIEKLGPVHPVRSAADFQMPLASIKQMYRDKWREAAIAFGYSEEAIANEN